MKEKDFHNKIAYEYGKLMKHYMPYNQAQNLARVEDIAQHASQFVHPNILDIGCGNGYVLIPVMKNVRDAHLYGIDVSERMIEVTKSKVSENSACQLQVADIMNLPFKEGSFDLVYCIATLHHLPDLDQALRESNRVLKNGGFLYLEEPSNNLLLDLLRRLRYGRKARGLRSSQESFGFAKTFLLEKVHNNLFTIEECGTFRFFTPLGKWISNKKIVRLILIFDKVLLRIPWLNRFGLNIRLWGVKC